MYVKKILGHKYLSSTQTYINLEQALFTGESDEFIVKAAENQQEAVKLLEVGFEYVGKIHDAEIFRKRK